MRDAQSKQLSDLTASLSADAPQQDSASSTSSHEPNTLASHLSSPFYHDSSPPADSSSGNNEESERSHDSVQKEIMDLRQKLDKRKKVDDVSPQVKRAREKLVSCLRTNDRRPLDCWEQVENFKAEVSKMEQAFIQKAGS